MNAFTAFNKLSNDSENYEYSESIHLIWKEHADNCFRLFHIIRESFVAAAEFLK